MTVTVDLSDIIRAVPPTITGEVLLDRGSSAAFTLGNDMMDVALDLWHGSDRWPTTGHDNLPKSLPLAPVHTYGADYGVLNVNPDYGTKIGGHLWNPDYDWATNAGPVSDIIGIVPFCHRIRHLRFNGRPIVPHIFMDWQKGVSEGIPNPDPNRLPGGTYGWYRDPFALDINEQPIDAGVLATMTAYDFLLLHNRRFLRRLIEDEGMPTDMLINMGGEDWRGWDRPFPWDPNNAGDPGQDLFYQYLADQARGPLLDLKAYATSKGWTGLKFCVGFLESIESGAPLPINSGTVTRNLSHFQHMLNTNGDLADYMSCSMHLRVAWDDPDPNQSFLAQDELKFAWFTPNTAPYTRGIATLKEARAYFKSLVAAAHASNPAINPNIDLMSMASSVGDTKVRVDPTQFQRGLMSTQYLIDLVNAGYSYNQGYIGFWGDKDQSTQGYAGLTGAWSYYDEFQNHYYFPFTIWPQYYALKLICPILAKSPAQVNFTNSETQLPCLFVTWDDGGTPVLSGWLINKQSGTRSIPVPLTGLDVYGVNALSVRRVARYSEAEQTAPDIDSSTVTLGASSMTVICDPYSLTYVELGLLRLGAHPRKNRKSDPVKHTKPNVRAFQSPSRTQKFTLN